MPTSVRANSRLSRPCSAGGTCALDAHERELVRKILAHPEKMRLVLRYAERLLEPERLPHGFDYPGDGYDSLADAELMRWLSRSRRR